MEPLAPPPPADDTNVTHDPRERVDDLLAGRVDRSDIDVRAFLLDPPPTTDELARIERRRRLVRNGSIAAAALVTVVLVAPWPGASDPAPGPVDTAEPAEPSASIEPASAALGSGTKPPSVADQAVRLDAPRPAPRGRRSTRSRSSPPAATPASESRAAAAPTARPAASQPAPRPTTAPAPAPNPAAPADPLMAPVM